MASEARVDAVEVGDVVPVVAVRRRVERHQPEARDAQLGQVVDPMGQPVHVAHAVAVPVQERLDVEAVDNGGLPPQVAGVGDPHRETSEMSRLRQDVFAEGLDELALVLADVVEVDLVETELGQVVEPRRVPAEVAGDEHVLPHGLGRDVLADGVEQLGRSRGPSTPAAGRRWCATARARSAAPCLRRGHRTGAPGGAAGPRPPASRYASTICRSWPCGLRDGDQPVGPARRPRPRSAC